MLISHLWQNSEPVQRYRLEAGMVVFPQVGGGVPLGVPPMFSVCVENTGLSLNEDGGFLEFPRLRTPALVKGGEGYLETRYSPSPLFSVSVHSEEG
jgi:hypothetical protein